MAAATTARDAASRCMCTMKSRSIFNSVKGMAENSRIEAMPAPKSSIANSKPRTRSRFNTDDNASQSLTGSSSVSSTFTRRAGRPARATRFSSTAGMSREHSVEDDALMAMGTAISSACKVCSTSSTRSVTRRNNIRSMPRRCAAGTKSAAAMDPSSGWSQRDKASAATTFPVDRLICGCNTTLMPSPVIKARPNSASMTSRRIDCC
ncbi:hypothetical protein D3C72_1297880 [compost metagenome]